METEVWTDRVVEETRRWREEILREVDYDLDKLHQRLMEKQRRHRTRLVTKKDLEERRTSK
jgi:hypothetical protein